MTAADADREYDVVVVGSGFGGAMAAHALVEAGRDVLMLERGDWVPRGPHNRELTSAMELVPAYSYESAYRVIAGGDADRIGALFCVGGPSVFYGGVSARLRERDFEPCPEISGGSDARWPFGYQELEPYYERAERLLGVTGEAGVDPTEPPRRSGYTAPPAPLSPISERIGRAAGALGLTAFPLPLAINHASDADRSPCILCGTCDCYPCSVNAKNDLATTILPRLAAGPRFALRTRTAVTGLTAEAGRVTRVECVTRAPEGPAKAESLRAREVVLAAGALATPHLLLSSGLDRLNPAGDRIGRYLMRHSNALVYGYFTDLPDPTLQFHKQLGIHDYYFGDPAAPHVPERIGSLQQVHHPPQGLVERRLPPPLSWMPLALIRPALTHAVRHATGLLAIAEDQPRFENGVRLEGGPRDAIGLPRLAVEHRYSRRDLEARRVLAGHARRILLKAGARFVKAQPIKTFSHAAGTVRMGDDPATAPLDPEGRFRGLANLRVVDASAMPTVGAVNPSLTISALALRAGARMAS